MRLRTLLSAAALLAATAVRAQAPDTNVITAVEVQDAGDSVIVSIKGTKPPNFTTFSMMDPPRFVIDLSESTFQKVPEDIQPGGIIQVIKNLSYGAETTAIARVMIAFTREVDPPDVQTSGETLVVKVAKPAGMAVAQAEPGDAAAKRKAQDEEKARAEAKARADAEATARSAQEARAKGEAAARARAEEEARAKAAEAAAPSVAPAGAGAAVAAGAAGEAKAASAAEEQKRLEAQAQAEWEAKAKAEDARARSEEEARAKTDAEARARAEWEAQAREQAVAQPEAGPAGAEAGAGTGAVALTPAQAKAQARAEAKARAAEEARARAEAKAQARAEAKAKAEEAARAKAEARAQAKAQAEEAARARAEAKAQAKADARARAEEEARAKAERRAAKARGEEVAALTPGAAEPVERSLGGPNQVREIGFQQLAQASRVFVRTSAEPRFTIMEAGENLIRVEFSNTHVKRRNDTRFLDTSFFPSAVALVSPRREGSAYVVEIKLRQRVPYQQKVEGDMLAIDFERPAGLGPGAPAAAGPDAPATEAAPSEGEPAAPPPEN